MLFPTSFNPTSSKSGILTSSLTRKVVDNITDPSLLSEKKIIKEAIPINTIPIINIYNNRIFRPQDLVYITIEFLIYKEFLI